jgi:hypothetical protein
MILPPDGDDIQDTICVLFSGCGLNRKPTVESLKRFGPVLICKSRIIRMLNFLVSQNEWYQSFGFVTMMTTCIVVRRERGEGDRLQSPALCASRACN